MAHRDDGVDFDLAILFRIGCRPQAEPRRRFDQRQKLLAPCCKPPFAIAGNRSVARGKKEAARTEPSSVIIFFVNCDQVKIQLRRQLFQSGDCARTLIVFAGEIRAD